MFFKKKFIQNCLLIIILLNIIICQKLSNEFLETWGEKTINKKTPNFSEIFETVEKYLVSEEGYSLEELDIIPFGFFKQTIDGIIYRLLCAVKKKSSNSPTIFDIIVHKHNNEFQIMSAYKPEDSNIDLSERDKKKMENAIMKYFFEKEYTLKEIEIEYEYHKLGGLHNYAIYDVNVELKNEDENASKRLLIIYRNDKTFTVEEELKEKED